MISNELIQKVYKEISNSSTAYIYFFNNLNSADWLKPLSDAGYFKNPTPLIREGNFIQALYWPESQYLVRVADKAPDEVLEIIKDNLQDIDNERIMDDVAKILLAVDVSKAVSFTDLIKKYVNTSHFFLLEKNVSDLVVKFADNNHTKAALEIAGAMLAVTEDPNKEAELKKDYIHIRAHTKYGNYDYSEILKTITPVLAKATPMQTAKLYVDLLQKTIDYEYTHFVDLEGDKKEPKFEDKKDDLSWIWRPKIEKDDEGSSEDPQQALVSSLRDTLVIFLENDSIGDTDKLDFLKKLSDHKYYIYKRIIEYVLRVHKDNKAFENFYNDLLSDDKLKNIIEHPIISHSGAVSYHPTNILESDLSDADILGKLRSYEPQDTFAFDRESLAKELAELVKLNPGRFALLLPEIARTRNEYLNESIQAFTEIVDRLTEIEVRSVLKSLTSIYTSNNEVEEKEKHDYYSWAKSSTLQFLEKLTNQKEDKTEHLTIKNIDLALGLMLDFCRETIDDEKDLDPVDQSINSIRGNAIHGLIYLLSWMRRNEVDVKKHKPIFDELTWHLDTKNDPSPAVRAVYGWRFEFLYGTNEKWTISNKNVIFSDDKLGVVAFDAFLRFSRVNPDELELVGDVFEKQLSRLKTPLVEDKRSSRHDALLNYIHHVVLLYWYFSLDLSEDSLMRKLLDIADVKYIKELTNFIGFRLYKKEAEAKPRQLDKLVLLWQEVVDLTKKDTTKTEALEEFGTWFASGKFDTKWSLEQLQYSASKAKQIHLDFATLEHLETLAKDYPDESLKALNAMVDGARERWAIDSWSSHAKAILQTAYNSKNSDTKESAKVLANKLVAKGYLEYRGIIK